MKVAALLSIAVFNTGFQCSQAVVGGCLSVPPTGSVSSGTTGKFFQLVPDTMQYSGAQAACAAEGGALATVKTLQEWKNITASVPVGWQVWFGLSNPSNVSCSNAACSGKLMWSDNSSFAWDSSWMGATGSASSLAVAATGGQGPCLMLQTPNTVGTWACSTGFGHVCEFLTVKT